MLVKIKNFCYRNRKWLLFFIGVIIFLMVTEDLLEQELDAFDQTIYQMVMTVKTPFVTSFFKVVTNFGNAFWLITIVLLLYLFYPKRPYSIWMLSNLIMVTLLNLGLKSIFMRPRPEGIRMIEESGYSFPSGHSMISMACYGLLAYLAFKKIKRPTLRFFICGLCFLLILLVGVSRIYLGVHYASDVLAGFAFSISYLMIFIMGVVKPSLELTE